MLSLLCSNAGKGTKRTSKLLTKTTLEKLRERLGLTRQQMAEFLGISRGNVERYEAVLTKELAAKCLQVVRQRKMHDLEAEFAMLTGDAIPVDEIDLSTANGAEAAYSKKMPADFIEIGFRERHAAIHLRHLQDSTRGWQLKARLFGNLR